MLWCVWAGGIGDAMCASCRGRRSSKILMPDLMGHHLSDSKGEERDAKDVNHKADFLYTKACSVVIRPQDPADKFNVDGEVSSM